MILVNARVAKWTEFPSSREIRRELNHATKGTCSTAADGWVGDDEEGESFVTEERWSGCRGRGGRL